MRYHCLTLSRRPLSYRNQSIDLLRKSMDWFLYVNGLRLERVKEASSFRRIDNQGQYSRWNCVLINTIPENDDEDTDKLAVEIF